MQVGTANARDLNAGFVLNEMSTEERSAYIAGVIEGIAYSRFLRDRPQEAGMKCINDWYYNSESRRARLQLIQKWFTRHKDKPVGPLLYILVRKECGE